MADRSLRGARLGAVSLQSEVGVEFSARREVEYRAEDGTTFSVVFSEDADIPQKWTNGRTGQSGQLVGADGEIEASTSDENEKVPRTHWDMLLERRTRAELEELLEERLQYLRARRGKEGGKRADQIGA